MKKKISAFLVSMLLLGSIGGNVVGKACVLAEGEAKDRTDIIYLEPLPLFFK